MKQDSKYAFFLDGDALLHNKNTLKDLIEKSVNYDM